MIKGQFAKPWEELDISDNFIFCKVMQNKIICKEMLERLLSIRIEKIEYLSTEHHIENFYDARGIRLDVFVKDSDRIFDLEIQTGNYDDLILRSRYYISASDVATTKRRTKFKDLKETYIIFICKDDPFGEDLPRYTRKTTFKETDQIAYEDKTHNVFYNCSAWEKEKDENVREVLKFIYGLKSDTSFSRIIEDEINYAKANSDFKDEYMYLEDVIEEEKEWAREEGLAEGREKGLAEGRERGLAEGRERGLAEGRAEGLKQGIEQGIELNALETAKEFLACGDTVEKVARCCKLPLETVQKLAENTSFN